MVIIFSLVGIMFSHIGVTGVCVVHYFLWYGHKTLWYPFYFMWDTDYLVPYTQDLFCHKFLFKLLFPVAVIFTLCHALNLLPGVYNSVCTHHYFGDIVLPRYWNTTVNSGLGRVQDLRINLGSFHACDITLWSVAERTIAKVSVNWPLEDLYSVDFTRHWPNMAKTQARVSLSLKRRPSISLNKCPLAMNYPLQINNKQGLWLLLGHIA